MPNLGFFNWVDVAILIIVAGGLLIGYSQGLVRQIISLGALYLAVIVATQYYLVLSRWIYSGLNLAPSRFVNVVVFLILLFGVSGLINFLIADAYQMTKLHFFPLLDQLGGSLLGLAITVVLLGLLIPVFQFVTAEPMPLFDNVRLSFVQGMESSRLVPAFISMRQNLLVAIAPWLPNQQIPSIFNP